MCGLRDGYCQNGLYLHTNLQRKLFINRNNNRAFSWFEEKVGYLLKTREKLVRKVGKTAIQKESK